MDFPVEGEHQSDGVLGHGVGRIFRHPANNDAVACRRSKVHIVESRAAQGDQAASPRRQRVDGRSIGGVVDEKADAIEAGGQFGGFGIQAGFVLSGAVYVEMVFQWPGVGRMLVDAILKRDILLVQGGVVFVAACYVGFNILVDVAQSLLDPRIRT
jgi:hypothetical protein